MTDNKKSGDAGGNQTRCAARNRNGRPCDAIPIPGEQWCIFHHPDRAEERKLWAVQGGKSSSNESRARRKLASTPAQLGALTPLLFATIDSVRDGELSPAVGSAIANLARAVVTVSTASDIEIRLAAVEGALGLGKAS